MTQKNYKIFSELRQMYKTFAPKMFEQKYDSNVNINSIQGNDSLNHSLMQSMCLLISKQLVIKLQRISLQTKIIIEY